jgi:hypothetical protein
MDETLVGGESSSFVSYMFSLSEGEKVDLLNMFQYLVLAIIPILLVNKFMSVYIPPLDRSKSTIEITTELLIQMIVLFAFIYFIHKLILFIPTYSKNPYPSINFLPIVLPVLIILFSLDKNLNEKSNILMNKIFVMVGLSKENFQEGNESEAKPQNNSHANRELMEPPRTSSPMRVNQDRQEPPSKNADYSQGDHGQQLGIPDYGAPMASNDYGGYTPF